MFTQSAAVALTENLIELGFSSGADLAAEDGVDRASWLKNRVDCAAAAGSPYLHYPLALSELLSTE